MPRNIMRIDVTAQTVKNLDKTYQRLGMTKVSMDSRLLEWFGSLDQSTQRQVLDQKPGVAEAIIRRKLSR